MPARIAIWDYKREHGKRGKVFTDLVGFFQALDKPTFRAIFQPSYDAKELARQFDKFCLGVLEAGNCTVLVEELGMVTKPNFAPAAWRRLCVTGRSYKTTQGTQSSMVIIATAQRPQMIDKDFLDNATKVHCGRLNAGAAVKTMAQVIDVPVNEISKLLDLEWIEKDAITQNITRGKLKFSSKRVGT
jgi:hypothetical protein